MNKTKKLLLIVAVVFVAGSCFGMSQFVKTNTNLIMWDYAIAAEAFERANTELTIDTKDEREVLKELGDAAFEPIWQTRDLAKPLLIRSKWYSSNLRNYLFSCTSAEDLTEQDIKILINEVDAIAKELNKISWTELRLNGTYFDGKQKEMFEVIDTINWILAD